MSKTGEISILVVEDSPTQAIKLQYLLEKSGYRVIMAQNGRVALEKLETEIPSLVISDIVMPEMNGFELCENIRRNKRTEHVSVILLTSLSEPSEVLDGLACGADRFINKPFNSDYLLANVESILSEKLSVDEDNPCSTISLNYEGTNRTIRASQQRVIKFLMNIYQGAIHQNKELILVRDELTQLNERLEELVAERTRELRKSQEEILLFNKELEKRISERTAQLEAANRAKSEFLANMSHEIRTPMNAVMGYADLLVLMLNDKTQKEYIESIKISGQNLLTLINDILDLSKIEAGKFEFEYEYTNSYSFFEEFDRIFALRISDKGLKYNIDISPEIPEGIFIDGSRLRQVIINLLGNAVKFTDKGTIGLKVYLENQASLSHKEGNKEYKADLIIEVSDTGIGISKEVQETIFEPFVQAQGQSNKKYGGTGLGLAISMRMVQLMNGSIKLFSEPGRGSTFRITIPDVYFLKNYQSKESDAIINPSEIVFRHTRIVVVDDVESNRKYLVDAMKNADFEIIEAENGEEALEVIQKNKPDLVITDILMDGIDGFELLKSIKNDSALKNIPVIAYSAAVLKEQKERIEKSAFSGVLIKPVKINDLYLELMNAIPYELKRSDINDSEADKTADLQSIKDIDTLIFHLENELKADWIELTRRQPLAKVKEFGRKIENLGNIHSAYILQDYGNEFVRAAESFNVESILNLLKKFNGISEIIKATVTEVK